jgi:hypothetical protein
MRSHCCVSVYPPNFYHFPCVRVVSKESRRLVLPRIYFCCCDWLPVEPPIFVIQLDQIFPLLPTALWSTQPPVKSTSVAVFQRINWPKYEAPTHLHLMPRLRMRGHLTYTFSSLCIVTWVSFIIVIS